MRSAQVNSRALPIGGVGGRGENTTPLSEGGTKKLSGQAGAVGAGIRWGLAVWLFGKSGRKQFPHACDLFVSKNISFPGFREGFDLQGRSQALRLPEAQAAYSTYPGRQLGNPLWPTQHQRSRHKGHNSERGLDLARPRP